MRARQRHPPPATLGIEAVPGHPAFAPLAGVPGVQVDLRYAGEDNVFRRAVYRGLDCAWVHVEAAAALARAAAWLAVNAPGERLLVLDALRPHRVQKALWDALSPAERRYVADPEVGSIHAWGLAVDATLVGADGRELDMGTPFDAMTDLSHPDLEDAHLAAGRLTPAQVAARRRLRAAMVAAGFRPLGHEWWHFDLHDHAGARARGPRVE